MAIAIASIDHSGRPLDPDGNFLCLKASAYDTCMFLGQDPAYADCTTLPAKVVDYYDATGFDVIEWATKGWMRGRGFTIRDEWQKFVAPDRGRKGPRKGRTSNVTEADLARKRALENGPDTWFSTPSVSKPKGPKNPPITERVTDIEKCMITNEVVKNLSKELKAELRENLQPQQWKPTKRGTNTVCRTVGEVMRTCRVYSTGNTTHLQVLSRLLQLEVGRMQVTVKVHQISTL